MDKKKLFTKERERVHLLSFRKRINYRESNDLRARISINSIILSRIRGDLYKIGKGYSYNSFFQLARSRRTVAFTRN